MRFGVAMNESSLLVGESIVLRGNALLVKANNPYTEIVTAFSFDRGMFDVSTMERSLSFAPYLARNESQRLAIDTANAKTSGPSVSDELQQIDEPAGKLRIRINSLKRGSSITYRNSVAARLFFLVNAFIEEGSAWTEVSILSLENLEGFLAANLWMEEPTITVTPSATFRAQWTKSEAQHLAIEFLADGAARFVVFSKGSKRLDINSGITAWRDLIKRLADHKIHEWTSHARTIDTANRPRVAPHRRDKHQSQIQKTSRRRLYGKAS